MVYLCFSGISHGQKCKIMYEVSKYIMGIVSGSE